MLTVTLDRFVASHIGAPVAAVTLSTAGEVLAGNATWSALAAQCPALAVELGEAARRAAWGGSVQLGPQRYPELQKWWIGTVYAAPREGFTEPRVHALLQQVGANAGEAIGLAEALAQAGVCAARVDSQLNYLYVNRVLAAHNGLSPEVHVGRPMALINPLVPGPLTGCLRSLERTGAPLCVYVPPPVVREGPELHLMVLRAQPGQEHWVLAWPTPDEPPPSSFNLAMLAGRVGIYDFDVARGVLVRSAGVAALLGLDFYPGQSNTSLWWLEHVHEEDRPRLEQRLAAWEKAQPAPTHITYRVRRHDGSWAFVSDVADLIHSADGSLARAVGAIHDETAEHLALTALRRSESRFRRAALATRDVVYDWDLTSDAIEWFSLAVFGYEITEETASGDWWKSQIHPDDLPRVSAGLTRVFENNDVWWRESYRFRRGNGEWAYVTDRGHIERDDDGAIVRMVGAMSDVTEGHEAGTALRRAREELEQRVAERTAELAMANEELEAFSYSVSHDLRAPLRAIDGFTRLVAERFADVPLGVEGLAWLARVRASVQRMARLTDELLEFAHVARSTLVRVDIDVAGVVSDIVAELRAREPDRKVEVVVGALPPASGDPELVRLVLQNLLENAWKFTRKQPRPRIEIGAVQGEGPVRYFVRDNGVGFDTAAASRLFKPFERLASSVLFEGTGIGLATVRRVVERHGGRVAAEGEPDRGATIWFTLPAP